MTSRVKHQTITELKCVLDFDSGPKKINPIDSGPKKINPMIWYICGFDTRQK